MKLRDLEIFTVAPPAPGWGGRYWTFVKLTTDDGITGYGECYVSTVGPQAMDGVIRDVFARHMQGTSAENIELMYRRVYSSGFTQRPDPTVIGAFSGLEIACWDIIGKARGRPVWALLGGRMNDRVRSYTYLYPEPGQDAARFWIDADWQADEAARMVALGFTAVKFDPAGPYTIRGGHMPAMSDITRSVEFCKRIREAVGDRADLLFGTHGQFTAAGAIRMARAIEAADPLWFEEPVPPDQPAAMAEVARATSIPIAAGERLVTKTEFARVIELRAAAILQPNLGRSGGLLETKKIAGMAEAWGIQIAPHCYCGPIVAAANIQLAATLPNFLVLESIKTWDGFHAEVLKKKIAWDDGFVIPSDEPGLGVELDEAVCDAHPWSGSTLHLEMTREPIRT